MSKAAKSSSQNIITVRQFVDKVKQLDLLNVMMVREVAKRTHLISDINPKINREAAL